MGFKNALTNFVTGAAVTAGAAKDKIAEGASVLKCETRIREAEAEIERCTAEIGRQYAASHPSDFGGEFGGYLRSICKARNTIQQMRAEITRIKGVRHCRACGAEIDAGASFCAACGARQ